MAYTGRIEVGMRFRFLNPPPTFTETHRILVTKIILHGDCEPEVRVRIRGVASSWWASNFRTLVTPSLRTVHGKT